MKDYRHSIDNTQLDLNEFYAEKFLTGTKFNRLEEHNDQVVKSNLVKGFPSDRALSIGNAIMPVEAEAEHILILGKPGVGKSVLINQIIDQVILLKQKVIIYDFKGDYLSKFYNPESDLIFNPLDKRSVKWNLIAEIKYQSKNLIKQDAAIEAIGQSLIPNGTNASGNDQFFRDGARAIFKTLVKHLLSCCPEEEHNNSGLIRLLSLSDREILAKVQETNSIAANFISVPGSNQTAGVLAVLSQFAESLTTMDYPDSNFTVFGWLNNNKPGALYVTGYADIRDLVRPVLSLLIDTMAKYLLSMPDSMTKRVYFILDEFCTLQRLNSLVDLLTLSRSKGGSMWLVTQDLSQVDNLYGKLRSSIVNSCGTKIVFAVADKSDAEEISGLIGDATYLVQTTQESGSLGVDGRGLSESDAFNISFNRSIQTKRVVLASNVMNQPKFKFLLRAYPFAWVRAEVCLKTFETKWPSLELEERVRESKFVVPTTNMDKKRNFESELERWEK